MALFDFAPRSTKSQDATLVKKSALPTIPKVANLKLKNGNLSDRIKEIRILTNKHLGAKKDKFVNIVDKKQLTELIDLAISNKCLSIDTETTSLDPITTTLAGVCLYTPGFPASYIPVNHVNFITGVRFEEQLSEEFVKSELQRYFYSDYEEIIMFNADFDTRVLKHTLGLNVACTWDCYIAARLLDENNPVNRLKPLWDKYVNGDKGEAQTFDSLFGGVPFNLIPLDIAFLYAANDPLITYELYEFQRPFLTPGEDLCTEYELEKVAWVFRNIEMAVLPFVSEMENTGVAFDLDMQKQLSLEYNEKLKKAEDNFYILLRDYKEEIQEYRYSQGSSCKLSQTINIASPVQLSILFYDVLKLPVVSKKEPRGTGSKILTQFDHPLAKAVLEYRGIAKLISTYIDKMVDVVNPKTGRIHCRLNQVGTVTGRFSSNDPNLQNIPAHNKDIRKMFKATDGYYMVSADYSKMCAVLKCS